MRLPTKPISDLDRYPRKFISPIQLATYFGISRRTVYYHIAKGALQVVRRGGVVRIHVDEAKRYVST